MRLIAGGHPKLPPRMLRGHMIGFAPRAARHSIALWLVAAACLLVAHDLVYLVQLGPGRALTEALRSAGHGYWPLVSGVIAGGALLAGVLRLARLYRLERRARGTRSAGSGSTSTLGAFLRLWGRLALVVAVAFVLQESAEHFISHRHAPWLAALAGPEYPLALPILGGITFIGALVASLVRRREQVLLARIRRGAAWVRPSDPVLPVQPEPLPVRRLPVLALPDLSRAPPVA